MARAIQCCIRILKIGASGRTTRSRSRLGNVVDAILAVVKGPVIQIDALSYHEVECHERDGLSDGSVVGPALQYPMNLRFLKHVF